MAKLRKRTAATSPASAAPDAERLLHELQVHQIELEMQNEELRASRAVAEAERERYQDLFEFSPVGYLSCDEAGIVTEANLTCATLLGTVRSRLVGYDFLSFVAFPDRPKWRALLERIFGGSSGESCEVALLGEGGIQLQAQVEMQLDSLGRECRAAVSDLTERKRAESERLLLKQTRIHRHSRGWHRP